LLVAAPIALAASDDAKKKRAEAALASALKVEQTAVVAYEAIANSGRLSGRATMLMRALLDDDRQHAAQLVTALEGLGVKPPIPPRRATIPGLGRVRDDVGAANFAIDLEQRAIGAYGEGVRNLSDANLLRTLAGAMGTDGQHLVVLRQLAGRPPVPGAFERGIRP
jgi:rubrerythrin